MNALLLFYARPLHSSCSFFFVFLILSSSFIHCCKKFQLQTEAVDSTDGSVEQYMDAKYCNRRDVKTVAD